MSNKVVIEHYVTFGKGEGGELRDTLVGADSPEFRQEAVDSTFYSDDYTHLDNFLTGQENTFLYGKDGGDWDDPTGGYLVVHTRKEMLNAAAEQFLKEYSRIEQLFSEEATG